MKKHGSHPSNIPMSKKTKYSVVASQEKLGGEITSHVEEGGGRYSNERELSERENVISFAHLVQRKVGRGVA